MSYARNEALIAATAARRRRLFRSRRSAHQADFGHRPEPAADLRADRQPAEPSGRLRPAQRSDPDRPDLRPEPALAAAGRFGSDLSAGARTAHAASPHSVARAADPEEHRQSDLRLRGAQGLSHAGRQGAEGRQGSDRLLVRARLGGARLSRRALCRGTGAPARASRGDARHGHGECEKGFAEWPAGRAGAGDARAHARRRAGLHAAEIGGA